MAAACEEPREARAGMRAAAAPSPSRFQPPGPAWSLRLSPTFCADLGTGAPQQGMQGQCVKPEALRSQSGWASASERPGEWAGRQGLGGANGRSDRGWAGLVGGVAWGWAGLVGEATWGWAGLVGGVAGDGRGEWVEWQGLSGASGWSGRGWAGRGAGQLAAQGEDRAGLAGDESRRREGQWAWAGRGGGQALRSKHEVTSYVLATLGTL